MSFARFSHGIPIDDIQSLDATGAESPPPSDAPSPVDSITTESDVAKDDGEHEPDEEGEGKDEEEEDRELHALLDVIDAEKAEKRVRLLIFRELAQGGEFPLTAEGLPILDDHNAGAVQAFAVQAGETYVRFQRELRRERHSCDPTDQRSYEELRLDEYWRRINAAAVESCRTLKAELD